MPERELPYARVLAIVRTELGAVEEAARRLEDDPKGVSSLHGFRKASRRLDACVDLAHFALKPTTIEHAHALTSALPRGLGKHRDADVVAQRAANLRHEGVIVDLEFDHPKGRRKDAERAAARADKSRLRKPLDKLLAHGDAGTGGDPLALLSWRASHRLKRAVATGAFDDLHALRLEVKSLRYGLCGIARDDPDELHVSGAAEAEREAGMLTDLLGEATDARVLASLVRCASAAPLAVQARLLARAEAEKQHAHASLVRLVDAREWPQLLRLLKTTPLVPVMG